MEFGVRVTIAVEYDNHIGARDNLTLDFAQVVQADSVAEAAYMAGLDTGTKVQKHLAVNR